MDEPMIARRTLACGGCVGAAELGVELVLVEGDLEGAVGEAGLGGDLRAGDGDELLLQHVGPGPDRLGEHLQRLLVAHADRDDRDEVVIEVEEIHWSPSWAVEEARAHAWSRSAA